MIHFEIPYAAVDRDSRRVGEAVADGYDAMVANVGDPRLWEPVGIRDRRFSVLTAPTFEESEGLTHFAQTAHSHLRRVAAVRTSEEAARFRAIGLEAVIDTSNPPGLDLAAFILQENGIPAVAIAEWVQRRARVAAPAEELLVAS